MRSFVSLAIVAVFLLCMATIALARGAPTKDKAFSDQAIVSVHVTPTVANVPPLTIGFDVILNMTTATFRAGNARHYASDTSAMREQSTTGDERARQSASYSARSGPSLSLVMLA